jgi:hypothetical protein
MSVKKFKFVSPGVFVNEVDNSQLPAASTTTGPVIIGRLPQGPGMRPITVQSFSEFIQIFGNPVPGNASGDVWRDGNKQGPTYASYAAQAYLAANVGSATIVRLLGEKNEEATAAGDAGWKTLASPTSPASAESIAAAQVIYDAAVAATGSALTDYLAEFSSEQSAYDALLGLQATAQSNYEAAFSLEQTAYDAAVIAEATAQATYDASSTGTNYSALNDAIETTNTAYSVLSDEIELPATIALLALLTTAIDATEAAHVTLTTKMATGPAIAEQGDLDAAIAAMDAAGVVLANAESDGTIAGNGGAYGLFICHSGSAPHTGSLAAVWYINSGSAVVLSGSLAGESSTKTGSAGLFSPTSDGPEFTAMILDSTAATLHKTTFNFDKSSSRFIRKVFNTNPQAVNGDVVPASSFKKGEDEYWLGETFESDIEAKINATTLGTSSYGIILPLDKKDDQTQDAKVAHTGWFFSQDITSDASQYVATNMQKLFRIHALDAGKWTQENVKVSIESLRYSRDTTGANPFGSFSVVLRKMQDTDNVVQVIERFSNCNLNPNSENYVARKIGNKYLIWSSDEKRLKEYGDHSSRSDYIRVEINSDVDNGSTSPEYLPYGVFGPQTFKTATAIDQSSAAESIILQGDDGAVSLADPGDMMNTGTIASYTVDLEFPVTQLKISSSAGGISNPKDSYFGFNASSYMEHGGGNSSDPGIGDFLYSLPAEVADGDLQYQWVFSLDDIEVKGTSSYVWVSGSRAAGDSLTADSGSTEIIDVGYARFSTPLYDGFDGLNITEIEPFRNTLLSEGTQETSYAVNTIRRAIDTVSDPEAVVCNAIVVPGMTNSTLTEHIINTCEDRGDSIAIIDIPDAYIPPAEGVSSYGSAEKRKGSVPQAISNLEAREINSSYACTYYPWVQIKDTVSGGTLWAPPSIVALGTFASSESKSEIWFAPAGFNRGGLSEGSAGIPVLGVSQRLTSKNRDDLYEANINPIASFPNEGIVIFGQKTLQSSASALDRINVRRMLIFVKKQISQMATTVLFDQNVQVTWNRFKSKAEPFLSSVQSRLGISEFKLVLDATTTTPDLVDQNIVYAKIFLKPARAIEYIAIDFVISNTGAGFED